MITVLEQLITVAGPNIECGYLFDLVRQRVGIIVEIMKGLKAKLKVKIRMGQDRAKHPVNLGEEPFQIEEQPVLTTEVNNFEEIKLEIVEEGEDDDPELKLRLDMIEFDRTCEKEDKTNP